MAEKTVANDAARTIPQVESAPGHPERVGGTKHTGDDLLGRPGAAQGDEQEQDDHRPASREAWYRMQRTEARAQVAELTEHIARMQEAEVNRLAAEFLHDPGDLILFGRLPDVLDDDGMVDPKKVRAAAQELVAARPGLARGAQVPVSTFGQGRRTPVDSGNGVDRGKCCVGGDRPHATGRWPTKLLCHRPAVAAGGLSLVSGLAHSPPRRAKPRVRRSDNVGGSAVPTGPAPH
jgi:hypothetical protein